MLPSGPGVLARRHIYIYIYIYIHTYIYTHTYFIPLFFVHRSLGSNNFPRAGRDIPIRFLTLPDPNKFEQVDFRLNMLFCSVSWRPVVLLTVLNISFV